MGFIKGLKLKNFQSHKDTEIIFENGLTVILGQTDQGKSAIIRALKWVLYNEPRGTDFITAGCTSCEVTLEMSNGTIITRQRDKNKNRYIVKANGKTDVFEGFGNNVPLEVIKAHGIPKIYIDKDVKSAVNLAEQLEPPFLISESGSNRAKALGRLVGVHIIDAAQRSTIKDLTDAQQILKLLKDDIRRINEELKEYDGLEKMGENVTSLKRILLSLKSHKSTYYRLCNIKAELEDINMDMNQVQKTLQITKEINKLENYLLKTERLYLKYHQLININNRLSQNNTSVKKETDILEKTKSVNTSQNIFNNIIKYNEQLSLIRNLKKDMDNIGENIYKLEENIKQLINLPKAEELSVNLIAEISREKKLLYLNNVYSSLQTQVESLKKKLKEYEEINKVEDFIDNTVVIISRLQSLQKIRDAMENVKNSINSGSEYLKETQKNLLLMTNSYTSLLKKFSKCPTCMSPIDDTMVSKIASEILEH